MQNMRGNHQGNYQGQMGGHYPDMSSQYEDALRTIGEAIRMARRGEYRKGYLGVLLEGLTMIKAASHQVGRFQRDGKMLDDLIKECQDAMNHSDPVHPEEESPLADLFMEEEYEDEQQDAAMAARGNEA